MPRRSSNHNLKNSNPKLWNKRRDHTHRKQAAGFVAYASSMNHIMQEHARSMQMLQRQAKIQRRNRKQNLEPATRKWWKMKRKKKMKMQSKKRKTKRKRKRTMNRKRKRMMKRKRYMSSKNLYHQSLGGVQG